jgi:hypothetical protein
VVVMWIVTGDRRSGCYVDCYWRHVVVIMWIVNGDRRSGYHVDC